jgi:hypothetical protein
MPAGPGLLALDLEGSAERLDLTIFSHGYTVIEDRSFAVSMNAGWNALSVDASKWPDGLLFARVVAEGHGGRSSKVFRFFVSR